MSINKFRIAILITLLLTGCNYNPLLPDNHLTGNPGGAVIGGAVGVGTGFLLGAPKPIIALAGIGGASVGYYLTTLRFSSKGIIQGGGQVYTLGDYVGIEIPTDNLFEANTHDFLPGTEPILESIAEVVERYPRQSIMISGNMSGFASERFETKLSEARAREIAAYLWKHGINNFEGQSINQRKLIYVGYGNYFPIANNIRLTGIRQNSRIQITLFPSNCQLRIDRRHKIFNNIGGLDDTCKINREIRIQNAFAQDYLPEGDEISKPVSWKDDMGYEVQPPNRGDYTSPAREPYTADLKGEMTDSASQQPVDYKGELQ